MMARTRTYADRVNVIKMIKIDGKWPFAPVIEHNGKIVRDHVLVNGKDEHHPEGRYYLEWYEDGKKRRQPIEKFEEAVPAARAKFIELQARKAGILVELPKLQIRPAPPAPAPGLVAAEQPDPSRLTMVVAIDRYLEFCKKQRSLRTFRTYRPALQNYFLNSFTKTYVDEVDRDDILRYIGYCFDHGLAARSVYDKVVTVLTLLKRHGHKKLIESSDWPDYVETIRPVYEPEEIHSMLRVATPIEALLIKFFLTSGFRNRETRFLSWYDLDFRNSLARVTSKPIWKFNPKNYEERVVPLPTAMIEQLQQLKEERGASAADLVFPNTVGKPDTLHLEIIKKVAWRAKLNCGQCVSERGFKCAQGPYCERIFLHKFRHTFATQHLRDGIDIRTLQNWMGHRSIKSTMVYLKGIQSRDALAKVNAGTLAAFVA
ncbi:Phage integrase [Acidisarcina polymorpha]|uniref:Phage integrase n=1 Tax=Acidisarcina polymorpha TaxID=2211140 RepID=A0A2Z5G7Z1_9BACT|nr:site-specific integrase [Acidisarcina polymorpha]AXC15393.1 Phage integrase [Acidisarcina polymorpha]